jgi:Circularly permutated YpsA SLOG family
MAEDGPIPEVYPVASLPGAGFPARTRQNVIDSDGTVILFDGTLTGGEPTGGSHLTCETAEQRRKPLLLIDASKFSVEGAAQRIVAWLNEQRISVLNVAGPRASGWPHGYTYAREVIGKVLQIGCYS